MNDQSQKVACADAKGELLPSLAHVRWTSVGVRCMPGDVKLMSVSVRWMSVGVIWMSVGVGPDIPHVLSLLLFRFDAGLPTECDSGQATRSVSEGCRMGVKAVHLAASAH